MLKSKELSTVDILTSVSDDTDGLTALTPNRSISGRSLNAQCVVNVNEDIDSQHRWKVVESLSNIYWKRFIREYIPSLIKCNKVQGEVKVDDIVLLYDSNTTRSFWPLARVIKVYPLEEEIVQSVTLKLSNTTLVRPVNKLYLLEEST